MSEMNENNKKEEGKPLFYNFWGSKISKWSFIFIVLVLIAMYSLKMCDSPYVVPGDPDEIKIID